MTHGLGRTDGRGPGGKWAVWVLAALLLLGLWSRPVWAVTLEGPTLAPGVEQCTTTGVGLAGHPDLIPASESEKIDAVDDAPEGGASDVPGWANATVSRETILRLAWNSAHRESSRFADILALGDRYALARTVVPDSAATTSMASFRRVTVIDESLGERGGLVLAAPRVARKPAGPTARRGFSLPWWSPLPLFPGLLALMVSVNGIRRSRPNPQFA